MCGIAAILSSYFADFQLQPVSHRGPDATNIVEFEGYHFIASVLAIQGARTVHQPYRDEATKNVLLWNGEVFAFDGSSIEGNDTIFMASLLNSIVNDHENGIINVLSRVFGPYAFIFYHNDSKKIYYGRDSFGRRSLLHLRVEDRIVGICSIKLQTTQPNHPIEGVAWEEVPIGGIYQYCLHTNATVKTAWPTTRLVLQRLPSTQPESCYQESKSLEFLELMKKALQRRLHAYKRDHLAPAATTATEAGQCVYQASNIGVLFSGGIDSVLLAALLHLTMGNGDESIDLINVSFRIDEGVDGFSHAAPDRLAAIVALGELARLYPTRKWNLIHVDVAEEERHEHTERIKSLIFPCDTHMDLNIGTAFWFASRGIGYLRNYSTVDSEDALNVNDKNGRPLLRVGGIGAAKSVGLKEWTNNKTKGQEKGQKVHCTNEKCYRNRKEGCDLCNKCCYKKQFGDSSVLCRIHKRKLAGETGAVVSEPASTTEQSVEVEPVEREQRDEVVHESIRSTCRVIIVGIGADEQLAGYGRHRTTYLRGGVTSLEDELNLDLTRLWQRNLGRDDRVITDHGREAWFPFLDEGVVQFIQNSSLLELTNLQEPPGIGDKKVLRQAAKALGIQLSSEFVKRAIQFGTRIAQETNVLYHGSHRKGKGTNKI
jgi:asparagine synthetase B (glutamine-hydrolysing)